MTTRQLLGSLALGVLGLALCSPGSDAQVVQRDSKVTGPKGKSIERSVRTERTPNGVQRDIRIQRPGGATFDSSTRVARGGGGPRPGPQGHGGPRPGGGGPPRVIERNVVVENNYYGPPRPRFGPSFGLFLGGPVLPPPPPPIYVVPEPIYVAPQPIFVPEPQVVYQPPVRYAPAPEPETVIVDPVADALGRLKSRHDNSRRDGALTLGRLGDARAVGPLMERLAKDGEEEVRVASAWALGEIGDPRAAIEVQKAALYDKKKEVREAAQIAYHKLGRVTADDPNVQVVPEGELRRPGGTPPPPLPESELEPLPDAPR